MYALNTFAAFLFDEFIPIVLAIIICDFFSGLNFPESHDIYPPFANFIFGVRPARMIDIPGCI
jgi:hypothetical protein